MDKTQKKKPGLGAIGLTAVISFGCGISLNLTGIFNDGTQKALPPPSVPGDYFLQGPAKIYDGDTIKIRRKEYWHPVRIFGIDTPELKQSCKQAQKTVMCGERARDAMKNIINDRPVSCEFKGYSLSRVVGTCFVDGRDIARTLVRAGWAVEEKHSDGRYKDDETFARKNRKG